jgi:hypothetical protein
VEPRHSWSEKFGNSPLGVREIWKLDTQVSKARGRAAAGGRAGGRRAGGRAKAAAGERAGAVRTKALMKEGKVGVNTHCTKHASFVLSGLVLKEKKSKTNTAKNTKKKKKNKKKLGGSTKPVDLYEFQ